MLSIYHSRTSNDTAVGPEDDIVVVEIRVYDNIIKYLSVFRVSFDIHIYTSIPTYYYLIVSS